MKTEWEKVRLDEMGTISRGRSKHRPRNDPALFDGKYPFIQTADVKNANLYISEYSQTYNEKGLSQSKLWQPGTLCITIAANIADTGILSMPACFPDSVMGFIPFKEVSDVRFVKYCFDILQRECKAISVGAAQDNLSWDKLSRIQFPCPPLETQQKIAGILSAYDDLIENNRKQIKLLEEAAQKLYKEWFVKLNFPGHENTKIVDGVPEGWKKEKLGNLLPIVTGKKDANYGTKDGKYPFFTCSQEPIKAPDFSFDANAILLAGNGDLNVKIYRGQFEAYQRTYVLVPYESKYLFICYRTIQDNLRKLVHAASGSTIKFITKGMIENIEMLIPNDGILLSYNNLSEPVLSKIEVLQSQIQHLKSARDKLLTKLMNGEIDVK